MDKKFISMKKIIRIIILTFLALNFLPSQSVLGQFNVDCSGQHKNSLFFVGSYFFRIDSIDTNPTAPIILDTNIVSPFVSLSINNILDSVGSPEVMYTTSSTNTYLYWNGSSWVNTGHWAATGNSGGTSNYIFNLQPAPGTIYRYDGTSSSVPIITGLPTLSTSIYDLATDSADNFYILYTNAQKLVVYDPNGMGIDSFPVTGINFGIGPGMAILGGNIYVRDGMAFKKGVLVGNTYQFTVVSFVPSNMGFGDMASCPSAAYPLPVITKKLATKIFVYPNPAQDYITIKAEKLFGKSCLIAITDVTGKKLREELVRFETNKSTLDVGELKKGIYFLRIENGEGSFVERFVKE